MSSSSTCCIPWLQRSCTESKDEASTHLVQPISLASDKVESTKAQVEAIAVDVNPNFQTLEVKSTAAVATALEANQPLAAESSPRDSSSSSASSSSSSSSSSSDSDEEILLESKPCGPEKVKPSTHQTPSFPPITACFPLSRSWPIYDISEVQRTETLSSSSSQSDSNSDSDDEIILDRTAYGAVQGESSPKAEFFPTSRTWPTNDIETDNYELDGLEVERSHEPGKAQKEEIRESVSLDHEPCGKEALVPMGKMSVDMHNEDIAISTTTNSMISMNSMTTNSMMSTNQKENLEAAAPGEDEHACKSTVSHTNVEPTVPAEVPEYDEQLEVYARLAMVKNKMRTLREELSNSKSSLEHSQHDHIPEAKPCSEEDKARHMIRPESPHHTRFQMKARWLTKPGPSRGTQSKTVPVGSSCVVTRQPSATPAKFTGRPPSPLPVQQSKTSAGKRAGPARGSTIKAPTTPQSSLRDLAPPTISRSFPLQSKTVVQKTSPPDSRTGCTSPLKVMYRSYPALPSSSGSTYISQSYTPPVIQAQPLCTNQTTYSPAKGL